MSKYKYLLFDADNTLFDFSQAEYNSFKITCCKYYDSYSEELYKTYSAINDSLWKQLEKGEIKLDFLKLERFRRLLTEKLGYPNDESTIEIADKWRAEYMENLSCQSCLIQGAEDICRSLSGKFKMYITTNGVAYIQKKRFTNSEIYKYFSGMFISEEIGAAKPSGKYFEYVLHTIGDDNKCDYLVIGDSLTSDCDGAINFGLDCCFYNPYGKSACGRNVKYNIGNLSELADILA
jgi:2-haloacid dehalogenase